MWGLDAGGRPQRPFAREGRIFTRLTREYDLQHPFVGAGMAFVSGPALAGAVSNAGGMGTLGNGVIPPGGLDQMIRATRASTGGPFGVGFLHATTAFGQLTTGAHIDVCVEHQVPVVVFFWGTPSQLWVDRLHQGGSRVWMQVGSVGEALEALSVGVDALICQGIGAGGHNRSTAPTLELLSQVRRAVGPEVMLLAAGGIVEGRDVARVLLAGAEGVWVGTRLVASDEAYAHLCWKQRLVRAAPQATVRTTLFGPEWPHQPIRVLRNRVVNQWSGREERVPPQDPSVSIGHTYIGEHEYQMPKFSAILPTPDTTGDFEEMCMPAGEGAPRIRRIQPAAEIVQEMMAEAAQLLEG